MKKLEKLLKNLESIKNEIKAVSYELRDTSYRRSGGYYGTDKPNLKNCIVIDTIARTKHLNTYICIPCEFKELADRYEAALKACQIEKERLWKLDRNKWAKASIAKARKYAIRQIFDGTIYTNYAKIFVVGISHIYLAHPYYQHMDYNKGRIMPNTPKHRRVAEELNQVLTKFIN